MSMEILILGCIAITFFLAQSFHNKADDVRTPEAVRIDSRNVGYKSEKYFLVLLGLGILLWLIGAL